MEHVLVCRVSMALPAIYVTTGDTGKTVRVPVRTDASPGRVTAMTETVNVYQVSVVTGVIVAQRAGMGLPVNRFAPKDVCQGSAIRADPARACRASKVTNVACVSRGSLERTAIRVVRLAASLATVVEAMEAVSAQLTSAVLNVIHVQMADTGTSVNLSVLQDVFMDSATAERDRAHVQRGSRDQLVKNANPVNTVNIAIRPVQPDVMAAHATNSTGPVRVWLRLLDRTVTSAFQENMEILASTTAPSVVCLVSVIGHPLPVVVEKTLKGLTVAPALMANTDLTV